MFDDQLAQSASLRELDRFVTGVKKRTAKFTAVIRINNACQHVETILHSETRTRCDASIESVRYRNRYPRTRENSLIRLKVDVFDGVEIKSSRSRTASRW